MQTIIFKLHSANRKILIIIDRTTYTPVRAVQIWRNTYYIIVNIFCRTRWPLVFFSPQILLEKYLNLEFLQKLRGGGD